MQVMQMQMQGEHAAANGGAAANGAAVGGVVGGAEAEGTADSTPTSPTGAGAAGADLTSWGVSPQISPHRRRE
eukprot:scaffold16044_cov67-Phaeocystis_antarctica.AAC.10